MLAPNFQEPEATHQQWETIEIAEPRDRESRLEACV